MKQLNILFLLFFSLNAFSQSNFMKWNEFKESDLKMTTYELDEEANAVVLGQTVKVKFKLRNGQQLMVYNYHVRLKILSKAGLDQATIELPYISGGRLEYIGGIKGTTANIKNGKLIKTKLEKKDIFREKINSSYSREKFTMPAVEVGSIIEYKYELSSGRITVLDDFYFQREIPVKKAEVVFDVPEFFHYVFLTQTPISFETRTQTPINYDLGAGYKKYTGIRHKWSVQNAPAIVEEDYITTINDYRQRLRIQLKRVHFPGEMPSQIFSNWPSARRTLMESTDFGRRFTKKNGIKTVSEKCGAFNNPALSGEEKIRGIYEFVQKNMKWDGGYSYYVDKPFNSILNERSGDVGEINLMLLSLLTHAGFDAYPVLLSTRSNGRTTTVYPILSQFDYMIVEVILDDKMILLDATDPSLPMGMVSYDCLNQQGWSLRGTSGSWINIVPEKALKIVQINLQLQEDGSATGFMKSIYNSYTAINQRKEALTSSEDEYLEERIKEDIPNIKIDSLVFKNTKKVDKKFHETIHFTIPEAADVAGDMIYFNPILNEGWQENPFQLKERSYPIDLGYPIYQQIIINVSPPEGYKIEELPENTMVNLLEKGGSFKFLSNTVGNGDTQIISKLKLDQSRYYPDDYQFIKQFFDMVIDKHSTQLVYKKTE